MRRKLESSDNILRDAMRVAIPVEDEETVDRRREKLLSAIRHEVAAGPERVKRNEAKRRAVIGLRAVVAAAAVMAAVGTGMFLQARGSADTVAQKDARETVPVVSTPQAGEQLATERGERQDWKLPGDTLVTVGESSGLRLLESAPKRQVMRLDYGHVDVAVVPAKVGERRHVSVQTPHAVVEVTGTQFTVDVAGREAGLLQTRVHVRKGEVLVRHARGALVLGAGEEWTSSERLVQGGGAQPKKPAQKAAPRSGANKQARAGQTASAPDRAKGAAPSSTLGEENALFEQALAAERRGEKKAALRVLERFMARYPDSVLLGAVRTKRARLLEAQ